MKLLPTPIIPAILVVVCVAIIPCLTYLGGLAGHPLAILLLPADSLPFLVAVAFSLWTIGLIVYSAIKRRLLYPSISSLILIVTAWSIPLFLYRLLPTSPFLLGFHRRISAKFTPDQLRLVAAKAISLSKEEDHWYLPSPQKLSLWDPKSDAPLWAEMNRVPGFSKFDGPFEIEVWQGNVYITWGGALIGHWGIRIDSSSVARKDNGYSFLALEPDIAVYIED